MASKKTKKRTSSKRRTEAKASARKSNQRVRTAVIALLILLVAAVGIGAGVGVWKLTSGSQSGSGEGEVKLSDSVKFPTWVSAPGSSRNSLKGYRAAVDHYDELSHIPCFCGCGQSAGHKNVSDCFVKSMDGDNIQFDNHGAG